MTSPRAAHLGDRIAKIFLMWRRKFSEHKTEGFQTYLSCYQCHSSISVAPSWYIINRQNTRRKLQQETQDMTTIIGIIQQFSSLTKKIFLTNRNPPPLIVSPHNSLTEHSPENKPFQILLGYQNAWLPAQRLSNLLVWSLMSWDVFMIPQFCCAAYKLKPH